MRTFRASISIVALLIALAAPGSAFAATHKAPTRFQGIPWEITIPKAHDPGMGGVISGRLQYHGIAKSGARRTAWLAQDGLIRVYRYDTSTGRLHGSRQVRTVNGRFRVEVGTGGWYRVQFGGSHNRGMCQQLVYVTADALGIESLAATSASADATGNVFLTLTSVISAPQGVVTSQTPAYLRLNAGTGTGAGPFDGGYGGPMIGYVGYYTMPGAVLSQTITSPGAYQFGFTVPVASRDQTLTIQAVVSAPFCTYKTTSITVRPSSLLP